jgi:hypothetical protein
MVAETATPAPLVDASAALLPTVAPLKLLDRSDRSVAFVHPNAAVPELRRYIPAASRIPSAEVVTDGTLKGLAPVGSPSLSTGVAEFRS